VLVDEVSISEIHRVVFVDVFACIHGSSEGKRLVRLKHLRATALTEPGTCTINTVLESTIDSSKFHNMTYKTDSILIEEYLFV
jgi:hypothetical protein